jgi:predicted small secreted protein
LRGERSPHPPPPARPVLLKPLFLQACAMHGMWLARNGAALKANAAQPTIRRNDMLRKLSSLLILAYVVLAGCNTMAGAGKDIERGGERIQGTAEKNR